MKIKIKIDCIVAIVFTKGTKRFHFYRNQYGVEAGVNFIPKHFGIFGYISHEVKT